MFGGLLGETVQSMHACGKDIEILDSFKYLGNVIHDNGGHVKKSYNGLAWPMVLWTRSARVSGVVGTCADLQVAGDSCLTV